MSNAREYYDRTSSEYVAKWAHLDPNTSDPGLYLRGRLIEDLVDMAHIRSGERVVEIGSGTGLVLKEALQKTRPVYGTDISADMLEQGSKSVLSDFAVEIVPEFTDSLPPADVYLTVEDIRNVSLPSGFFDVVLSLEVLRYVDDVDRALRSVRGILGDQSRFVFSVTNPLSSSFFPIKYRTRQLLGRVDPESELLQYFETERSIRRRVHAAGLRVVDFRRNSLPIYRRVALRSGASRAKAEKVDQMESRLSKVPLLRALFDTFLVSTKPR